MRLIKKSNVSLLLLFLFLCTVSCEKEFNTIGTTIISGNHFETEKMYADVFTYNRKINAIQTNGLPIYQLGRYTDPVYGETQARIATQLSLQIVNPTFGTYSQELEDNADTDDSDLTIQENETVTRVYLDIPFFSTLEDTDEDGNRTFELDSIYGNENALFNLRVEELTFYLKDLDPESNFETPQEYFSDQDFSADTGALLFDETYSINDQEIIIYEEDDPETEESEADNIRERLDPRIRIELDPAFFQQTILDAEGSEFLANINNFREYFRGLYISADSFSDDVLMLLNLSQATIEIEYSYDKVDTNGTADDASDDEIFTEDSSFTINLSGNILNTFSHTPYPVTISDQLNTNTNASRLYLKGGAGTFVEIKLFDEDETNINLDAIRANKWLINEANLTFYIDREALDVAGTSTEPQRLYLYDMENNTPLLDHLLDATTNLGNPAISKTIYSGILEKDEEEKGIRYKIRLTEHINNLIRRDSTNVRLGLVLTSDINNIDTATTILEPSDEIDSATASVINPLGTVLFGSDPGVEEDKRLRLEIFYTEYEN
ncbi:MAG: DUF4270 domain-containing protein [Bacteroidota bacterium]